MTKKYTDNAPQYLIKLYEENGFNHLGDKYIELIHKLLTKQEMATAWKSLNKRITHEGLYSELIHKIFVAYSGPSKWELMTSSKKQKLTKNIVKNCEKLIDNLSKLPTEYSISLFSNIAFDNDFTEAARTEYIMQFFGISLEEKDIMYFFESDEPVGDSAKMLLGSRMPVRYLTSLSKDIKSLDIKNRYIKKPNLRDVNIIYFVRYIGEYFNRQFDQHLYETIAIITLTIFNNPSINANRIRDMLIK